MTVKGALFTARRRVRHLLSVLPATMMKIDGILHTYICSNNEKLYSSFSMSNLNGIPNEYINQFTNVNQVQEPTQLKTLKFNHISSISVTLKAMNKPVMIVLLTGVVKLLMVENIGLKQLSLN